MMTRYFGSRFFARSQNPAFQVNLDPDNDQIPDKDPVPNPEPGVLVEKKYS
jgi:hypothetical protein